MTSAQVHVGVDVGGTNTDAVVLQDGAVVGWAKKVTTADVTTGVASAIVQALNQALTDTKNEKLFIKRVHIGTTHFVNAVVQCKGLAKVSVVRLCGPAANDLEPFIDFPQELQEVICGSIHLIDGGYEYDGCTEIRQINPSEVRRTINYIKETGIRNVVISGIFSPVNPQHEIQVCKIFEEFYPEASLTLSHEIGQIGLLERENASILNESLKPLCATTIAALRRALDDIGLSCPIFLTQNDGTLNSAEQALLQPVNTFASGPTNSMRGAAFLSGLKDAVVVDVGGTTTDVGILLGGFPKDASYKVKVGEVRTNFRMPDVLSIGLGGGSRITNVEGKIKIGPDSVGYRLEKESLAFGGDVLTASDLAISAGLINMGNPDLLEENQFLSDKTNVSFGVRRIREMVEETIDRVKTKKEDMPLILVGGGSVLVDCKSPLLGTSDAVKPSFFQVANAVGAALSQVSGSVDYTVDLTGTTREAVLEQAKERARDAAIRAGADQSSIVITEVSEVPLAYLPSNVTRVKVKAVGDLRMDNTQGESCVAWTKKEFSFNCKGALQNTSATGQNLHGDTNSMGNNAKRDPYIDASTGEWILSEWDVECIAVGAGILGCGGGGNPYLGKLMTLKRIREGHQIKIITPERFCKNSNDREVLVTSVSGMGAPTISGERKGNTFKEFLCGIEALETLIQRQYKLDDTFDENVKEKDGVRYIENYHPNAEKEDLKKDISQRIHGIFSAEIGGSNSMSPLYTAPLVNLPVIDCDGMGRAFPELQHYTPLIYGAAPYPSCLSDYNNRRDVVLHADTPKNLENHFRKVCMDMGCSAALVEAPLGKQDLCGSEGKVVLHSLSRAWRLGNAVWQARLNKANPIETILEHEGGKLLFIGKISDVQRKTTGGFARGELHLDGFDNSADQSMVILFQNENLVAKRVQNNTVEIMACVPDLISLVDHELGEPIPTEEVRYGLRVAVIAMPAPPLLRTPQALACVGPQAFGYPEDEVTFKPMGDYITHDPIPPM